MSSREDSGRSHKRRRMPGSCDACRKKKARCDSSQMPGGRCTNCIASKQECIHDNDGQGKENTIPAPKRLKLARETVAEILSPSTVYLPSQDPGTSHEILVEVAIYARSLEEELASLHQQPRDSVSSSPNSLALSTFEDTAIPRGAEPLNPGETSAVPQRASTTDPQTDLIPFNYLKEEGFSGRSGSVQFINTTMKQLHGNPGYVVGVRRPEFWDVQPWRKLVLETPHQIFPENDLLMRLVQIYFDQINPLVGILHFPSFRQSLSEGLHHRDPQFGSVVLAVCSLASRYSDDPRVFLDEENSEHSCGWKYFQQVRTLRTSLSPNPSLAQLQVIYLSIVYLACTTAPEEVWLLAGLGIRLAQAAGAHHRSGYARMQPLEAELYKRVFWGLAVTDTLMGSFRGRPRMSYIFEFDVDLPADCNEEYWGLENPAQPPGQPSSSAHAVTYLKLMMIFERIQAAVYPANGIPCSQDIIAELDCDLNRWVDEVPEHLQWDPQQENQIFFDQSASLYSIYYHAQILMHRPYIPAPGKKALSSINFPSLAICANAARSCGHVLDVQARRGRGLLFHPNVITALFDCAVVLLINVWAIIGGRNSSEDFNHATADVQNCVHVLRLYERRWRVAGRQVDIINAMLNMGKYTSAEPGLKRPRREEAVVSSNAPEIHQPRPREGRPIAGPSRVMSVTQQIQALELSIQETEHPFALPLRTEELGRLPVYESFGYQSGIAPGTTHFQPEFHIHHQSPGFVEPQPFYGIDSAIEEHSVGGPQRNHFQMPASASFEMPTNDAWRDWSAYLTNVHRLNSRRA
ncbi:fungal-specific transcription factor domain-containing protein [Mycena crocata]|nr:fungal-specific transcription factor domain-containing protein [Mycena crocata]